MEQVSRSSKEVFDVLFDPSSESGGVLGTAMGPDQAFPVFLPLSTLGVRFWVSCLISRAQRCNTVKYIKNKILRIKATHSQALSPIGGLPRHSWVTVPWATKCSALRAH